MELEQRIAKCKQNKYEMNNFIMQYKPFIANVVQKHVRRYVQYGKDDELSVGLMAFEEAIMGYNDSKGAFLSFAETVIKRRLIDYFRKESKHSNLVPISVVYNENEESEVDISEKKSIENFSIYEESEQRKLEILEVQNKLKEWGISFFELAEVSPKHEETKKIYSIIINSVLNNLNLLNMLLEKKYLPIAEIEKITKIHRKKIERSRKYVIAMVLILTGDYKYIQSFIEWKR